MSSFLISRHFCFSTNLVCLVGSLNLGCTLPYLSVCALAWAYDVLPLQYPFAGPVTKWCICVTNVAIGARQRRSEQINVQILPNVFSPSPKLNTDQAQRDQHTSLSRTLPHSRLFLWISLYMHSLGQANSPLADTASVGQFTQGWHQQWGLFTLGDVHFLVWCQKFHQLLWRHISMPMWPCVANVKTSLWYQHQN